jgi:uncharacterized protein YndB with AHSA1/START domain
MPTITSELIINRPIETVWRYATDLDRELDWVAGALEREQLTDGPVGNGTRFRRKDRFLGKTIDTAFEVTEYDPPNRMVTTIAAGPLPGTDRTELRTVDGGTSVTFRLDAASFGGVFGKLADKVAARMLSRIVNTSLENLKDLIEAEA